MTLSHQRTYSEKVTNIVKEMINAFLVLSKKDVVDLQSRINHVYKLSRSPEKINYQLTQVEANMETHYSHPQMLFKILDNQKSKHINQRVQKISD